MNRKLVFSERNERLDSVKAKECGGAKKGFTLVEIIVSFAILALISTALITGIMGIIGMQARDDQQRNDGYNVESRIANGTEADETVDGLSLPLGDYTLESTAETYNTGIGSYTVLNQGESSDPEVFELDGDDYHFAEYTVPKTGYYKLEVWGASGGGSALSGTGVNYGGRGGYATGTIYLSAEEGQQDILYLNAGGAGFASMSGENGGVNGGGTGGIYDYLSVQRPTGGGGGASDIRVNSNDLYSRVLVAGGGGGAGCERGGPSTADQGGYGGGESGHDGIGLWGYYGYGGTIRAGGSGAFTMGGYSQDGSYGVGGSNTARGGSLDSRLGGGGGGGWYGGGAGSYDGGGGGSGWALTKTNYNNWTNASDKAKYLLVENGESNYWLLNEQVLSGNQTISNPRNNGNNETGMSGNGFIRITWVGTTL